MFETAAVYLFVALVLIGGIMVAFVQHTLRAIIGLGLSLFGMAGLFLSLGSPFVAAMQVLIYIGGITVAMVFAMMLSEAMSRRANLAPSKMMLSAGAALVFFAGLGLVLFRTEFATHAVAPTELYTVESIGHGFLTSYNLVFEALSLILLVAILGAVLIAKKEAPAKA